MSFRARFLLAGISLFLVGCSSAPDGYPPPAQHLPFRPQGIPSRQFLAMDHPEVTQAIVKDVVVNESGPWRWTGPKPELRFQLSPTKDWTFMCEFVINDRTFQDTGPVTISFFINEHLAEKQTYSAHGDHVFEHRVPPGWIKAGEETRVRAEIQNPWKTPSGDLLGILLKRVGFVE